MKMLGFMQIQKKQQSRSREELLFGRKLLRIDFVTEIK